MHILKSLVITVSLLCAQQQFATAQAPVAQPTAAAANKFGPEGLSKGSLANQFDHLTLNTRKSQDSIAEPNDVTGYILCNYLTLKSQPNHL